MILSNIQTFIIYSIAAFFMMVFCYLYKKQRNITLLIIAVLPAIIISTFRHQVGTDFINYNNAFIKYSRISIKDFVITNNNSEIGYFLINKISYHLGSFKFVLFFSSLITILLPIVALKDNESVSLPIFSLLYYSFFFLNSFNLIRQGISISIGFYALYKFIQNKKRVQFILLIFVAATFHMSVIVLTPLILLIDNNGVLYKNRAFFLIISASLIAINWQQFLIFLGHIPFLNKYIRYMEVVESNNYIFFINLIIYIFFIFFINKIRKIEPHYKIIFIILSLDLIFLFIGFKMPYIKRISLYFNTFSIYLISTVHNIFKTKERFIIKAFIFIYGIAYLIAMYWFIGHSNIFPYQF